MPGPTAANAGAEDVRQAEEGIEVITATNDLEAAQAALTQAGYTVENAEVTLMPSNTIDVQEPDIAKKLLRLLDALENHDDVQQVYANFDMAEDLVTAVTA